MPFQPGHPKYGGKKKGFIYSEKAKAGEMVSAILGKSVIERLLEIATQQPKYEVEILTSLLPYTHPKMQTIEFNDVTSQDNQDQALANQEKMIDQLVEAKIQKRLFDARSNDISYPADSEATPGPI